MKKVLTGIVVLSVAIGILPLIAAAQIKLPIPKLPGKRDTTTSRTGNSQSDGALREAFYAETQGVLGYVAVLMRFHQADMMGDVNMLQPSSEEEWQEVVSRLTALDQLCTTKYKAITDDPSERPNRINRRPKTWCEIAAKRVEYIKLARDETRKARAEVFIRIWRMDIEKAANDQKGFVYDDIQRMLFDQMWKTEKFVEVQKAFTNEGLGEASMTVFDAIEPDLAKVRARIDKDSKTNVWEQPPNTEPAMESFFKTKLLANPLYKGTQVLKIGSNYADWHVFKNSLGIPTSRYKRGLYLAKRPGQNGLCQIREWIVRQDYAGGRFGASKIESYGGAGIYAKCQ